MHTLFSRLNAYFDLDAPFWRHKVVRSGLTTLKQLYIYAGCLAGVILGQCLQRLKGADIPEMSFWIYALLALTALPSVIELVKLDSKKGWLVLLGEAVQTGATVSLLPISGQ